MRRNVMSQKARYSPAKIPVPKPFKHPSSAKQDGSHWKQARTLLDDYDNGILEGWKDEINTQLLVASLLAAVTATFIIEAQKDLAEDPAKASALFLSFIAMQINGSANPPPSSFEPFTRTKPIARAVSSLFYASLALSLANVTLGLLSLQWIRDLTFKPPGILNKDYLHFRWVRHRGFEAWGAKDVVITLPLILLSSLATFFAALLIYVSDVDWIVASSLYAILTPIFAIITFTTLAPSIIVILHTSFHPAGSKKVFTTMPPFRSLQSWIALRFGIGVFALLKWCFGFKTYDSFRSLRHCPDWGRVDQLWTRWFSSMETKTIITPLVLSTSNSDDVENIISCYQEIVPPPKETSDERKRLTTLRKLVEIGEALPPYTLGQVTECLIDQLESMVRRPCPIVDFGGFKTEGNMDFLIEVEATNSIINLMYAVVNICKLQISSGDVDDVLNLLWNTLRRAMVDFEGDLKNIACSMLKDALDACQGVLESHGDAATTPGLPGFRNFAILFAQEVRTYRYWIESPHGAQVGSAILLHPVWEKLKKEVLDSPAGPREHISTHREDLADLEHFKHEHLSKGKEAAPADSGEQLSSVIRQSGFPLPDAEAPQFGSHDPPSEGPHTEEDRGHHPGHVPPVHSPPAGTGGQQHQRRLVPTVIGRMISPTRQGTSDVEAQRFDSGGASASPPKRSLPFPTPPRKSTLTSGSSLYHWPPSPSSEAATAPFQAAFGGIPLYNPPVARPDSGVDVDPSRPYPIHAVQEGVTAMGTEATTVSG